jgi:hypothetical protein
MNGENLIRNAFEAAHNKVWGPSAPFLDPATIITLISTLLGFIRQCRSPSHAARHAQRGSAVANKHYRDALKEAGYPTEKINAVAAELTARGRDLTQADIRAILDEANEIPDPWGFNTPTNPPNEIPESWGW